MISATAAVAIWLAAWVVVATLARTTMTARLAFVLTVALLPLPWLLRAPDQQRVFFATMLGFLFTSAADFAAGRRPITVRGRLAYVLAFAALIDPMTAVRIDRRFEVRTAGRVLLETLCGAALVAVWVAVAALPAAPRIVLRLIIAAAVILLVAEITTGIVRLVSTACGVRLDPLHDHPYRSRTLVDFWSRRWNRMGGRWFRQHAFARLRAKSTVLALFGLFALSAVMHVYLIASVVPAKWMLMCALFFLVQPPLLLTERRLRIGRWPPLAGRLWTMTILVALLPLLLVALGIAL